MSKWLYQLWSSEFSMKYFIGCYRRHFLRLFSFNDFISCYRLLCCLWRSISCDKLYLISVLKRLSFGIKSWIPITHSKLLLLAFSVVCTWWMLMEMVLLQDTRERVIWHVTKNSVPQRYTRTKRTRKPPQCHSNFTNTHFARDINLVMSPKLVQFFKTPFTCIK